MFILLSVSIYADDSIAKYNKDTRALYLRIIRANSKSAAREIFIRNPDYLELAYYASSDSEMRSYCLGLLFLQKNTDLLDVPYNKYKRQLESFSDERKEQGVKELKFAISNMCNIARGLVYEIKNNKNSSYVQHVGYRLKMAEHYSTFGSVIFTNEESDEVRFGLIGKTEHHAEPIAR